MIGDHKHAVLEFSGGADSTALLYLARPWLDRITVMFVDPGATYPHVLEHIFRTCAAVGARLEIIRPHVGVRQWHAEQGLPSDVVPGWNTAEMVWTQKEKPAALIQSTASCCRAMLWHPKMRALQASGATLVLRGSKAADERVGVAPGFRDENGVEYASPLWDWTDADVLAYLKAEGVELPAHYAHVKDSLDCYLCTGHTGAHYARKKLTYTRGHHPDLWAELAPRLRIVRDAITSETKRHADVLTLEDNDVLA